MEGEKIKQARVTHMENVVESSWITLQKVHYIDGQGCKRVWERCARTSPERREHLLRNASSNDDNSFSSLTENATDNECPNILKASSVIIVPLASHLSLHSNARPQFPSEFFVILVKQFRPPVGAYTLEFPAGLIDKNEAAYETAKRELKEETGFSAHQLIEMSPLLSLSPGMASECCYTFVATIDLDSQVNKHTEQNLDEEEEIEVLRVPLEDLEQELKRYAEEGLVIFDGVYNFALGLNILAKYFSQVC